MEVHLGSRAHKARMIWIVPSEKDRDNAALDKRLQDAADQFRANSGLKSHGPLRLRPRQPAVQRYGPCWISLGQLL